ncbi:MAG: hypothetical protein HRU41_10565 [Saprospiraceae bacterium]|nr:hypothetical protein [Saprospiraceae bacterium]
MHKKLLEVLRVLSAKERGRFQKFVHSPYYNEQQALSQLLNAILIFAPDFDAYQIDVPSLFQQVYPGQPFDRQSLNRLNSKLFKLLEQFIVAEQLNGLPQENHHHLMDFYLDNGLEKQVEVQFRKLRGEQSKLKKGDPRRIQRQLIIEKKLARWEAARDRRRGDINLQAYNAALDRFFLLEKLELINAMLGRERVIHVEYQTTWLEEIKQHVANNDYADWPAIELYAQVLLLQLEPTKMENYFRLKRLLLRRSSHFLPAEQRAYFSYLEGAAKSIFPISGYFEELFSLYQAQLESGALLPAGKLHHTVFKNIVLTALELGHFYWVEQFIATYEDQISPRAFRKQACLQNRANLHYYRKEYGEAQKLLLQSNPRDTYYKLSQKSLLARIYFENKEIDLLLHFLNTFGKFVFDQKRRIAPSKIESYRLFVNTCRRLCHILEKSPEGYAAFCRDEPITQSEPLLELKELQEQIQQGPIFYSKKWLLERIDKLIPQT